MTLQPNETQAFAVMGRDADGESFLLRVFLDYKEAVEFAAFCPTVIAGVKYEVVDTVLQSRRTE